MARSGRCGASRTTRARWRPATSAASSSENYQDVKVGDVIEPYEIEQVARRLNVPSKGAGAVDRRSGRARPIMVVGVLRLDSCCPRTHSLKGKRSILRSIKARVQQKFNVSIAECEDHDLWQRTVLGVSQVGADQPHVDRCLRSVVCFIEDLQLAEARRGAGRVPALLSRRWPIIDGAGRAPASGRAGVAPSDGGEGPAPRAVTVTERPDDRRPATGPGLLPFARRHGGPKAIARALERATPFLRTAAVGRSACASRRRSRSSTTRRRTPRAASTSCCGRRHDDETDDDVTGSSSSTSPKACRRRARSARSRPPRRREGGAPRHARPVRERAPAALHRRGDEGRALPPAGEPSVHRGDSTRLRVSVKWRRCARRSDRSRRRRRLGLVCSTSEARANR